MTAWGHAYHLLQQLDAGLPMLSISGSGRLAVLVCSKAKAAQTATLGNDIHRYLDTTTLMPYDATTKPPTSMMS